MERSSPWIKPKPSCTLYLLRNTMRLSCIEVSPYTTCFSDFRSEKCLPPLYGLLPDGYGCDYDADHFTPPCDIFRSYFFYSAPVLLIDIWSLGVVFAEIVNGRSLVDRVRTESCQLRAIFRVLGIPTVAERARIPGIQHFKWGEFENAEVSTKTLAAQVPRLDPAGIDLLSKMLCWVPENRISPNEALSHPFFSGRFYDLLG